MSNDLLWHYERIIKEMILEAKRNPTANAYELLLSWILAFFKSTISL